MISSFFGLPIAWALLVAGAAVLLGSIVVHWLLLVAGVILVVVGAFLLLSGTG